MTIEQWSTMLTPFAVLAVLIMQRLNARKVKSALDTAADKSDSKLDVIHGLVNGAMVEQRRVSMLQSQRIAELTQDPKDIELATDALKAYSLARDRQLRVDAALSKVVAGEHRVLTSDGPMVQLLVERLETIERAVTSLSCISGKCPPVKSLTEPVKQA